MTDMFFLAHLGRIAEIKTRPGAPIGLGEIVSVCDAPTFELVLSSGQRAHWRQDLCAVATAEQAIAYWKERALLAEAKP